ncbi:hypothetical protein GT755_12260 [Herbidospora sp. NEAU-GS84]|uniref:Uncharacterized protein n=1 Tax=Herbidospora solisilvae TaxID=2696284 RepID=A0A7C9NE37_9ACTN|nr:hypothetical protein [Herbidospora solisilvae]NAS22455.1 hypothetical protein [Herbidospora solisilvae]
MSSIPSESLKTAVAGLRTGNAPAHPQAFAAKLADWLEMTSTVHYRILVAVAAGQRSDPALSRPMSDLGHALTVARTYLGEEQPGPRRGDAVETWLKARRDQAAEADRDAIDALLDAYRLHVDYGVPLGVELPEEVAGRG